MKSLLDQHLLPPQLPDTACGDSTMPLAERVAALSGERSDLIALVGEQADDIARLREIIARQNRALRRANAMAEAGYRHIWLAHRLARQRSAKPLITALVSRLRTALLAAKSGIIRRERITTSAPSGTVAPDSHGATGDLARPPILRRACELPLRPFPGWATLGRRGPRLTLVVVAISLPEDALDRIVGALEDEQRRKPNFSPVFITTSSNFRLFRQRGFSVEHLPPPDTFNKRAPDLDWLHAMTDRAHLFRRKWQPDLVIVMGDAPLKLVKALRGEGSISDRC